ncbi:MAG: IS66 family insertion sequence element accessory protein TnpB [Candidatus Omnitrophica bacterium]|nr:IS66 family insertion sequence element accessory protein TnpB [Candidatus Omnitrophota bacterium]
MGTRSGGRSIIMMAAGRGGIFLYRGTCDLRRSFDRLARMVVEELGEDPLGGSWFIFLSADRRKVKVLYWDFDGYALWYKRLEAGRFELPAGDSAAIDRTELVHLLEGIKAEVVSRQPRYRREKLKIVEEKA